MDSKRLIDLITHWRVLAAEARGQGDNPTQAGIFRAHAFGISDGLELAANDLFKLLDQFTSSMLDDTKPARADTGSEARGTSEL